MNFSNYRDSSARIETTLGELICAISEAAHEAMIEEDELALITQMVLRNLLRHNTQISLESASIL